MKIKTAWFVYHPFSYGIATLCRIGLRFKGHQFVVHIFKPAPPASKFHDHPWRFTTRVLWGEYIDESLSPLGQLRLDRLRLGAHRQRPAEWCHRMTTPKWTLTLVHTYPKERNWCEGVPGAWNCDGAAENFDSTRGMSPAQWSQP